MRESLIQACEHLLYEKSIDEIVERASVAKGSFYNHFSCKETLAAEVSQSILQDIGSLIRKLNENVTDAAYRLVRDLCIHMQLALENPRGVGIMLQGHDWIPADGHQLFTNVNNDITLAINRGRFMLLAQGMSAC